MYDSLLCCSCVIHASHIRGMLIVFFLHVTFGLWERRLGDGKSIAFPYLVSPDMGSGCMKNGKIRGKCTPPRSVNRLEMEWSTWNPTWPDFKKLWPDSIWKSDGSLTTRSISNLLNYSIPDSITRFKLFYVIYTNNWKIFLFIHKIVTYAYI